MLTVIEQNQNFVLVVKPAGWLSVPSRLGAKDLRPCLGILLQDSLQRAIYPVHRLDEPVSGIMLFALNPLAHRMACAWFEKGQVKKTYEAITPTTWSGASQSSNVNYAYNQLFWEPKLKEKHYWQCKIAKGKKRAFLDLARGKESLTVAELVEENPQFLRWNLQPLTGRAHQLRFEMWRHGYAILGDALYGSPLAWAPNAIALRAFRLNFLACENASALGLAQEYQIPGFSMPSEV